MAPSRFTLAASALAASFKQQTRTDGSTYLTSTDGPEWFADAIREAHAGELPNDSRYALIADCAQRIADDVPDDADEARENAWEHSSDAVPVSTYDVIAWFADHTSRLADCETAASEIRSDFATVEDWLREGYRVAAYNVLTTLIDSLEENHESYINPDTDTILLLTDANGIYIPQLWCNGISKSETAEMNISWEDVEACQHGPDGEFYWEAWEQIIDNAEIADDSGDLWRLHQNGDLWQVRTDVELPEGF